MLKLLSRIFHSRPRFEQSRIEAGEPLSVETKDESASAVSSGALAEREPQTAEPSASDVDFRSAQSSSSERVTGGDDILKQWRTSARRNFSIVAIFSLFINLLMLTIPIYLFQLSDRVLTSRSLDTLIMLTVIAVAFLVILALLDIARRQVLGRVSLQMETLLAAPILAGAVQHAQGGTGSGINAMRGLTQVRTFVSGPLMLLVFDAPMAPIYFAAVFLIHPSLGFICVVSAAILVVIALWNQRATREPLSASGQLTSKADAHVDALGRNAQVVNAMGMLNEGIRTWGHDQSRALEQNLQAQDRNYFISGLSKFVRLVTQIAMLGFGAYLALSGAITGGTMIAASIIAGRALAPIEGLIEGWRNIVQTRSAYARAIAIVEMVQRDVQRLKLPKPKGKLTVDKILYITPTSKEPVLNGVSFELAPGESVAIVGPSGSGKSTLAKIAVGCLNPTAGKVRLDGTELKNWDRRQFGAFTGYLPQEVELFPGTIKANIARMHEDQPDSAVWDAANLTSVHDIITQLPAGYETVIDATGAPLSGGQRQRIGLARAFYGEPSFVVLDEPNSNLDSAGEEALAETLRRAKSAGTTVVVVTQRPALLQCVDKVLVLRQGRVEAYGTPQEVLHRVVKPNPQPQAPAASPQNPSLPSPSQSDMGVRS